MSSISTFSKYKSLRKEFVLEVYELLFAYYEVIYVTFICIIMIYYQVKRVFSKPLIFKHILRYMHNEMPSTNILFPLQNRKLLKVAGDDASRFLHGLITNDMEHFTQGAHSMYAMFLNNKGRVLFDTLIYKYHDEQSFLLECDESVLPQLTKHLKIYKLRSAVQIEDLSKLRVWALLSTASSEPDFKFDSDPDINFYKDPRLSDLGYRVISSAGLNGSQVAKNINKDIQVENSGEGYKYLRYKLGVSEGAEDLPPGTCFPLEANCDYLHGVSFHKGCYIGQEVTARVHHTGVVRKRMMPLKITSIVGDIQKDAILSAWDKPKTNFGKIKGIIRDYGIGLVRIKEAMEAKVLKVGESTVEPLKPTWWPIEAPKEKASLKTEENMDKIH